MDRTLSFGLKTTQYFPYAEIVRVWKEADALPSIDHAWLFDHPMPIMRANPAGPCLDGWTTLAALAAHTQRLRLGLMVASNTNQTPPQLAKRAATVDVISDGRLEFGFGAGGVEREHTAYGTPIYPPAELVRRMGEAVEIIRRMWIEPVVDYEGRCYQVREAYCEPKPVQKPSPTIILGGIGEQITLRIVAKQADAWNYPMQDLEQFRHLSGVLDHYCNDLGRDPLTLVRSVQLLIDPKAEPAATRETILGYIRAGATHFVLGPRSIEGSIAKWLCEEIIEPVREAAQRG